MTHPNKRIIHEQAMKLNEKRKEANREILRRLTEYLQANPSIRFSQALSNLDIVDRTTADDAVNHSYDNSYWSNDFYIESEVVLKRMK
jgi:hypothetical protein